MKRGIPIALQAAGAVLACLVTTVNCSPMRSLSKGHAIQSYYNEDGDLIHRDTLADSSRTFVIRTAQKKGHMYADYFRRYKDTKIEDSTIANIESITKKTAMRVEHRIKRGNIESRLVRKNIIPIEAPELLLELWKFIPDTGNDNDPEKDFREYGGSIEKNGRLTPLRKDSIMDACKGNAGINIDVDSTIYKSYYHTHPSGEKQHGKCGFTQAPSYGDQMAADARTSYVLGMKSHRVYVMNKDGVLATIPFCFFLLTINK